MDMETEEIPPDDVVEHIPLESHHHSSEHMIFSEAQLAESLCESEPIVMEGVNNVPIEMIVQSHHIQEQGEDHNILGQQLQHQHQHIHMQGDEHEQHILVQHECHEQQPSEPLTQEQDPQPPLVTLDEEETEGMGGAENETQVTVPALPEPEVEVEPEICCSCLLCQNGSSSGGGNAEEGPTDKTTIKCLVCYAKIDSLVPHDGVIQQRHSVVETGTDTKRSLVSSTHQEGGLERDDVMDESNNVSVVEPESNSQEGSSSISMDGNGPVKSKRDQMDQSTRALSLEEEPQIKLSTIFQILKCSLDEIDQPKDIEGFLEIVPLCAPCHSVVTDAVLIYKEIEKLEKTLGNLRETIKDQIVKSFEANFCKKRKDTEQSVGLMGQIDATRRAILSEGVSLSSFKGSKRGGGGGKRKKTIVSKSALYPHVTLEPLSGSRRKVKKGTKSKPKAAIDEDGVKQECGSEQDDSRNDDDFGYGDDEFNEEDEEEEVTFLQTHSGRVVKRPNYKKWLLAEEDEEEEEVKPVRREEGVESPKSEPEWSPGHTDEEGADDDFDSDTDSSADSEPDLDSEEELDDDKKILDEFGELLGHGEEYIDPETGEKMIRTTKRTKQGKRVKCTECNRTFADEAKRDIHIKRKHTPGGNAQTYVCDKCSKTFRRPGLLRKHREKQHGEVPEGGSSGEQGDKKRHMCDFCGQKYRNASELRIHVRIHTGETPYKCEHCDKSFVSSLKREFHIEQSHWEVPPLKCDYCPKAFFRQHRLRIHRISHTGEKAYLCEICSQSFSHPTYLKYHQGQHAELNLETFKCNECGKIFANPTNLRLHTKTVHLKQFRFHCEVCSMGFTHMSHKRIHMRGHTGERPYKCEQCNESFRYRDRLRIHMRGHTGERPFVCEMCKKGFASRSKLKRHEKIHEKNQPPRPQTVEELEQTMRHRCDDCGKGFAEPQHLSAHRRYCQRKILGVEPKEERKPAKASQSGKIRATSTSAAPVVPKVEQIPVEQPLQPQPAQMLLPIPVNINYTYPVTYTYEVPQVYHTHDQQSTVREYPNYN